MAHSIAQLNGTVIAPNGTFPYGDLKDDPSGTRVDTKMMDDLVQFFQRCAALSGVNLNGLFDNAPNGFQFVDGVFGGVNANIAPLIINLIGSTYSTSTVYLLQGSATAASNGIVFYNGKVYALDAYSGPVCGGGTVPVIVLSPSNANTFMPHLSITCAASGSGIVNYADITRVWGRTFAPWTNVSTYTANFASAGAAVTPRFTKNSFGQVYLMGAVKNNTASPVTGGVMFTLPAGYIPTHEISGVISTNGYVIRVNGDVELVGTLAATGGAAIDFGSLAYLTI